MSMQIGAINFGLTKNKDGTFTSTCLTADVKPATRETRYFKVPSSSDPNNPHTVTVLPNGHIFCDGMCLGFSYRRTCSHCDSVRNQLEGGVHGN